MSVGCAPKESERVYSGVSHILPLQAWKLRPQRSCDLPRWPGERMVGLGEAKLLGITPHSRTFCNTSDLAPYVSSLGPGSRWVLTPGPLTLLKEGRSWSGSEPSRERRWKEKLPVTPPPPPHKPAQEPWLSELLRKGPPPANTPPALTTS